jgi:hypothetical protein
MPDVTDDPVSPRRRRRRAVWRAGVGISHADDPAAATAATPEVDDTAVQPRPAPPPERPGPTAAPAPAPSAASRPVPGATSTEKPPIKRRRPDPTERGLRDLVGAGPSQLGPVRAMRARDVNRPTAEDLAEADQDTAIVRRHWKPPTS